MNDPNLERELKLRPDEPALLDRLAAVERLGEFRVAGRRREIQRNSFFDSSSRALSKARVSFRRRTVQGESLATWTIKGGGMQAHGVSTRDRDRPLHLDPHMAPGKLAIDALRQAARQRRRGGAGRGALATRWPSAACRWPGRTSKPRRTGPSSTSSCRNAAGRSNWRSIACNWSGTGTPS